MYKNKKILILGAAKSGISVAKLLAADNEIVLTDLKEIDENTKKELEDLGIKIIITDNQLDLIDFTYDLIIKNPAVMSTSPLIKKINELNIELVNEMEVAYHFLPNNVKIIGITGSNGKTTVTTITYELLKRFNQRVVLGGNIGMPLSQIVENVKENDILLLEISDHQLCDFKDFKTNISVLTNIYQTHLDYHGTYDHYKATKKKIFNNHTTNDIAIINNANQESLEITSDIKSKKIYFNNDNNYYNNEGIFIDNELIINKEDILLQGNHNYENILAALIILKQIVDLDKLIIKEFLKDFGGVAHRIEFVKEINGVKYYNDSKATNTTATITALKTFNKPIHLILGGYERNQDFNDLNDYISNVVHIYAVGTVTNRVVDYAKNRNIEYSSCDKLSNAMGEIKKNVKEGDIVLLSPASSSQDYYSCFEERGDEFKKLVANL